jgi:hypothetical protein
VRTMKVRTEVHFIYCSVQFSMEILHLKLYVVVVPKIASLKQELVEKNMSQESQSVDLKV